MKKSFLHVLGIFIAAAMGAQALTVTQTGTFTTDDQIFTYNFNLPTSTAISFFTTSYGGGSNVNGTTATAGGFVPVLTLFSGSGSVITSDGGTGTARGPLKADPITHLFDDAYIFTTLAAGNYTLTLSEFPNVALGNLSDGFLFAGSPSITGDTCGVPGGKFLQADVTPCVQRTGNFALNVNTPEPATLWLVVPALGAAILWRRRQAVRA